MIGTRSPTSCYAAAADDYGVSGVLVPQSSSVSHIRCVIAQLQGSRDGPGDASWTPVSRRGWPTASSREGGREQHLRTDWLPQSCQNICSGATAHSQNVVRFAHVRTHGN